MRQSVHYLPNGKCFSQFVKFQCFSPSDSLEGKKVIIKMTLLHQCYVKEFFYQFL